MQNLDMMRQVIRPLFVVCFLIPLLTSCESRRTIVNRLTEKEANEIIVFLSTKGIEAYKVQSAETGGAGGRGEIFWNISVPADQATRAMSILNQSGLPRRRGQSLLGIFREVGLVPSEMQEKIRYQAGLAEQIGSTIRKIDGVLDAEVQISFPEEDPLNPGQTKGDITASVYVKHSGVLDDPNELLDTKIKRLVTASVTGLKYDNVTVIGDRARFSDYPIGLSILPEQEKEYVTVWTIVLAKQSLTRFRIIFFSFTVFFLLLLLAFFWIGWKIYPVIQKEGGFSKLFTFSPFMKESKEEKKKEGKEKGEEEEEEEEGEEEEEEEEEEAPPKDVT